MKLNKNFSSITKLGMFLIFILLNTSLESKLKSKQNDLVLPLVTSKSNFPAYSPIIKVILILN